MRQVSVRIAGRRDPFIDLHHVDAIPGDFLAGQITQHLPRRVTAAHRDDETSTGGDGRAGFRREEGGRLARYRVGIRENLDFHVTMPRTSLTRSATCPLGPPSRQAERLAPLRPAPTSPARIRAPVYRPSARGRRSATPLPRGPPARTGWRRLPSRRPAPARMHPSRP